MGALSAQISPVESVHTRKGKDVSGLVCEPLSACVSYPGCIGKDEGIPGVAPGLKGGLPYLINNPPEK